MSAISGIDAEGDGRGLGLSDWDGDGDLDAWISNRTAPTIQVFENQWGSEAGDFLSIDLQGTKSNRDAAGARVTVMLEGMLDAPLMRTVKLGEGFQSQSSKRLHFGLGKGAEIASVVVRWPGPDFEEESFSGLQKNGFYLLRQGAATAEKVAPKVGKFAASASVVQVDPDEIPAPGAVTRLLLPVRPLFPVVRYNNVLTGAKATACESGKPTLLLLWHPDCASCFSEMTALAGESARVESMGIEVVATTAAPADAKDGAKAAGVIAKTKFPFVAGFTDAAVVERMLALHRHLFYQPYHLAVPTSFLIDARGRLVAVYRGPLEIGAVAKDLETLGWTDEECLSRAELFKGTRLEERMGLRSAVLIKVYVEAGMPDEAERVFRFNREHPSISGQVAEITQTLAQSYFVSGDKASARRMLLEALEHDPDHGPTLNNLGALEQAEGNVAEAVRHWRKACELDPSSASPRLNLGKLLMRANETSEAMGVLLEFDQLEPDSPDGHNYLSIGYLRLREFEAAERHLKRLIELRPSDGNAYANLAKIYAGRRDLEAAARVIDQGLAADSVKFEDRKSLFEMKEKLEGMQ